MKGKIDFFIPFKNETYREDLQNFENFVYTCIHQGNLDQTLVLSKALCLVDHKC